MVNLGAFSGSRKEFLLGEKAAYSAGVDGGYARDALAVIHRRYFKRFPIDLPHDEEPTAEFLSAVDDSAAEPELAPPGELLGPEEYAMEVKRREARSKLIEDRKKQVKRWLTYQHMKDRNVDPKSASDANPYHILLQQLTGVTTKKPRSILAVNVWRKDKRADIEAAVRKHMKDVAATSGELSKAEDRKLLASVRESIARDMFNKLSEPEKVHWVQAAQQEYKAALDKWTQQIEASPSTSPVDCQMCIQGLVQFVQPILDMIHDSTGWSTTLIAGGPEPAHEGRLNVISVHSGTTQGDVKLNFGQAERVGYKTDILRLFGNFLRKCYSPEECRSRALPNVASHAVVQQTDIEELSANYDTVDTTIATPTAGRQMSETTSPTRATSSPPSVISPAEENAPAIAPTPTSLRAGSHAAQESYSIITPTPMHPTTCQLADIPSAYVKPSVDAGAQPAAAMQESATAPSAEQLANAANILGQLQEALIEDRDGVRSRSSSVDPWAIPMPHPLSQAPSPIPSPIPSHATSPLPPTGPEHSDDAPIPTEPPSQSTKKRTANTTKGSRKRAGVLNDDNARPKKKGKTGVSASFEVENMALPSLRATRGTSSTKGAATPVTTNRRPAKPTTHSALTSSPTSIECPEDAAPWLVNAISMFSAGALGTDWLELVQTWLKFELQPSSPAGSKLQSTHRPTAVADWIRRKRSSTWRPLIGNVAAYGTMHMDWWCSLQPSWRLRVDGSIDEEAVLGDWDELRKWHKRHAQRPCVALLLGSQR